MAAIRGKPRSASVYALDDVEALHVTGSKWLDFLINHARATLAQLYASQERIEESTRKSVESLLSVEQDLADIAGVSLDSVKQVIRSVRERGMIMTGRQALTIVDIDSLNAISRGDS